MVKCRVIRPLEYRSTSFIMRCCEETVFYLWPVLLSSALIPTWANTARFRHFNPPVCCIINSAALKLKQIIQREKNWEVDFELLCHCETWAGALFLLPHHFLHHIPVSHVGWISHLRLYVSQTLLKITSHHLANLNSKRVSGWWAWYQINQMSTDGCHPTSLS